MTTHEQRRAALEAKAREAARKEMFISDCGDDGWRVYFRDVEIEADGATEDEADAIAKLFIEELARLLVDFALAAQKSIVEDCAKIAREKSKSSQKYLDNPGLLVHHGLGSDIEKQYFIGRVDAADNIEDEIRRLLPSAEASEEGKAGDD